MIYDAYGGIISTVTHDSLTKQTTFARTQDHTAIIENNKALAKGDGYNQAKDMRRVANVPIVVLEEWLKQAGIPIRQYMQNTRHYAKWLRSKVYDKDNEFMLTAPHLRKRKASKIQGLDSIISEGRK